MRILYYLGYLCLVIAFIAAGTEPFLVTVGDGNSHGLMTSAYDLWYALAPHSFIITKIRLENVAPVLWSPGLSTILALPAWLLFLMPGLFLAWYFRPNKVLSPEAQEEYDRHRESLFILDDLSREAKGDLDFDPSEDDRAPVHLLFDREDDEDDEDRLDIPANYPSMDEIKQTQHDFDEMTALNMADTETLRDLSEVLEAPAQETLEQETPEQEKDA